MQSMESLIRIKNEYRNENIGLHINNAEDYFPTICQMCSLKEIENEKVHFR